MKIEITIVARGKSAEAVSTLKEVTNKIRSGWFQREGSDADIKVKANVKVLEDKK